jgi:DNA replication protein DnaC
MSPDILLQRAKALKLHGLLENWSEIAHEPWVEQLLHWEEAYRFAKSLHNRLRQARIGQFKTLAEFDWNWPKQCDRGVIEQWMQLDFIKETTNPILCGPNGVGKSTIARNITHQSVLKGLTALFTTAAAMLNELAAIDSDSALRRRVKYYAKPALLVIDEVGYLSYSNRHADLLFEIISQRYEKKSTFITTNKAFTEWREIFPNATCVVSIVDRLVHHSEIVNIEGESYRLKEAKEKNKQRQQARRQSKSKSSSQIEEQANEH